MDDVLDQAAHYWSPINRNLHKSYKINGTHNADKTLAKFLAFASNLADWQPVKATPQPKQPKIVNFLEMVISKRVLRDCRYW